MPDPIRLGPWRNYTVQGSLWVRLHLSGDELTAIAVEVSGWTIWAPVEEDEVPDPIAKGSETGQQGRDIADAAARALGWVLDEGFPTYTPEQAARIRAAVEARADILRELE